MVSESINHVNTFKKVEPKPKKEAKEEKKFDLDANGDGKVDEKDTSIHASRLRRAGLFKKNK